MNTPRRYFIQFIPHPSILQLFCFQQQILWKIHSLNFTEKFMKTFLLKEILIVYGMKTREAKHEKVQPKEAGWQITVVKFEFYFSRAFELHGGRRAYGLCFFPASTGRVMDGAKRLVFSTSQGKWCEFACRAHSHAPLSPNLLRSLLVSWSGCSEISVNWSVVAVIVMSLWQESSKFTGVTDFLVKA